MAHTSPPAAGTARLSDRQRECLLLIRAGLAPKEIARRLDLSVETVNAHLKAARRVLGVGSSREAARLVPVDDGQQSMGNQDLGMAATGGQRSTAEFETGETDAAVDQRVDEVSDSWTASAPGRARHGRRIPIAAGRLNDLSPLQRILAIAILLAAGVVVLAGLVSVAFGLQQMLRLMYFGR